ncbi:MAG: class I SAM-dependent methyltransferase [Desulfohalobiaceae bacterium]|nr:class I SAM-dependent methyltransferase [Desulfohalobiaceae bacterium]
MSDWTDGYVSDIEYTAGFYKELAPSYLNLCALIHGYVPPDRSDFNYLELGCGRGLSSLILAAANPKGNFYAVDFNPAHIHEAKRLVREAELDNIRFIEASFEEVAEGRLDLPECQYIVLHGIYTWVSEANRKHLRHIVRNYLASGGLVYNSYKTQKSIRELRQELNVSSRQVIELAMVMIHAGWMHPVLTDNDPEPSRRLNRVLAEQSVYSNQSGFLAAPLIGSAKVASLTDFLILAAVRDGYTDQQSKEISRQVWQGLSARNLKLKTNEQTLDKPRDNIAHLQKETLPVWRDKTLPLWKALGLFGG